MAQNSLLRFPPSTHFKYSHSSLSSWSSIRDDLRPFCVTRTKYLMLETLQQKRFTDLTVLEIQGYDIGIFLALVRAFWFHYALENGIKEGAWVTLRNHTARGSQRDSGARLALVGTNWVSEKTTLVSSKGNPQKLTSSHLALAFTCSSLF